MTQTYNPTANELSLIKKYITTIATILGDKKEIRIPTLFGTIVALWTKDTSMGKFPSDIIYTVVGPQSITLKKAMDMLENEGKIEKICISCGTYGLKANKKISQEDIVKEIMPDVHTVFSKIMNIYLTPKNWTLNVFCGLFSKGGGMKDLIDKQKRYAKDNLNEEKIAIIINAIYSPIVGRTLFTL